MWFGVLYLFFFSRAGLSHFFDQQKKNQRERVRETVKDNRMGVGFSFCFPSFYLFDVFVLLFAKLRNKKGIYRHRKQCSGRTKCIHWLSQHWLSEQSVSACSNDGICARVCQCKKKLKKKQTTNNREFLLFFFLKDIKAPRTKTARKKKRIHCCSVPRMPWHCNVMWKVSSLIVISGFFLNWNRKHPSRLSLLSSLLFNTSSECFFLFFGGGGDGEDEGGFSSLAEKREKKKPQNKVKNSWMHFFFFKDLSSNS